MQEWFYSYLDVYHNVKSPPLKTSGFPEAPKLTFETIVYNKNNLTAINFSMVTKSPVKCTQLAYTRTINIQEKIQWAKCSDIANLSSLYRLVLCKMCFM